MVVDYAAEAVSHGAVYLEGIFRRPSASGAASPWEDESSKASRAGAEDLVLHPLETSLTLDIHARVHARRGPGDGRVGARASTATAASSPSGSAGSRRNSAGAVPGGVRVRPSPLGLGSVPHAGEVAGAASVRGALRTCRPTRIRHGIRGGRGPRRPRQGARGPGHGPRRLPLSNLRTGAVAPSSTHRCRSSWPPGVQCSISTDDPAMLQYLPLQGL